MKLNIRKIIKEEIRDFLTEKEPMDYDDNLLIREITKISNEEHLPIPTKKLDTGSDAMVFQTTKEGVLIRVEQIDEGEDAYDLKEYTLSDYDIQETGGVAEIYNIDTYLIGDKEYLISWKEKVEENFEHIIYNKYDKEKVSDIIHALHLYDPFYDRRLLDVLKNTKETSKLYDAVMQGLPTGDLSPDSNMGINKEGYIVAFDV